MKLRSHRKQRSARRAAQLQPAALRQARKTSPHPSPLDASPRLVAQRQRLDGAFGPALQRQPERSAGTAGGLPAGLKAGIASLSGFDMSDVRVHANSSKPAEIGALAYAQGNDIHLGPGQEQHLPHEAWHLVQQRQGRVKPTMQTKGVAINDDPTLEHEADAMGARASENPHSTAHFSDRGVSGSLEASVGMAPSNNSPVQRLPANLPRDVTNRIGRMIENLANECEGPLPLAAAFADFARHVTSPRTRRVRNGGHEITRLRNEIQAARNMRAQQALTNLTNYLQQHNLI